MYINIKAMYMKITFRMILTIVTDIHITLGNTSFVVKRSYIDVVYKAIITMAIYKTIGCMCIVAMLM